MIAVVLGGAENVLSELADAKAIIGDRPFDIILVNDMIACYPGAAAHGVTMHWRKMAAWLNQRQYRKFPPLKQYWINTYVPKFGGKVTLCWGTPSGLFGVKVAVSDLGYKKVILCGIPMQAEAKHFLRHKPWADCDRHRPNWIEAKRMGNLKSVRSMSGWTQELLGKPNEEWLDQ